MPAVLDPHFKKYHIPQRPPLIRSGKVLCWQGDTLAFSKAMANDPVYPVCYQVVDLDEDPLHTHRFFEITLVLAGSGTHQVGTRRHPMGKGDLIFVNNRAHHAIHKGSNDFWVVNLCFMPSVVGFRDEVLDNQALLGLHTLLQPFREFEGDGHEFVRLRLSAEQLDRTAHLALHMVELFFADKNENRELMKALLRAFFLMATQWFRKRPGYDGDRSPFLMDTLAYIHDHFASDISLAPLARHFGLSPTYFSRTFNRLVGKNLRDYVNGYRVEKARELLVQTRLPVSAVARETGFESDSHFSAVFRSKLGVSPKAFRLSLKKE